MPSLKSPTDRTSGLYVRSPEGEQLIFPLKHTEVRAKIAGNLSRVEVSQQFENPFTKPLEAVYIFPLPEEAAVDEMEIKIGDRTIKGSIKKREEAQKIYEKAKQEGRTAGLLEQERDNIFTQSLANIKPGESIDVTIRYTDSLKFLAGDYEFIFPMVVGPRYIPGTPLDETAASGSAPAPMTVNSSTDIVPDASRLNAPILPPGMRSGHDIGVTLEIEAGVPIRNVNSPSHQLQIEYFDSPQTSLASEHKNGLRVRVQLGNQDTIPNKDLIVRYQIAGRETQSTVLTQADDRGGHFAVYLIPAIEYKTDEIVPKDVVFLVDTSGSQSGAPLQQCQALLRQFINGLNPADTFSILDFSDKVRRLSQQPLPNTAENRQQAIEYINKLRASGGTEMLGGIRAAIDFPAPSGRLRTVVFLSDGYIGNENQVLAEVQQHLKSGNRLYSFGAGSSVNRFLLDRIAEIGRGISRIIRHDEPVNEFVEKFFRQINNPVLVNLEITWQGEGENPVIYPSVAPDLFAEQPLVLFGKKGDRQAGTLHIKGVSAGGHQYVQTYQLDFTDPGNPAVAQLWGRHRIKDLMNQMVQYDTKVGVETVTETALTYQLLSQYTAFVAVSDDVRVEPTESISMNVPVEMPEAVEYEGVFGGTGYVEDNGCTDWMEPEGELERGISFKRLEKRMYPLRAPARASAPAPSKARRTSPVEVVSAAGLDEVTIDSLNQHLATLTVPPGTNGELVLEIVFSKVRPSRIVVDAEASTLADVELLKTIKKWLFSWRIPHFIGDTVRLTLRVRS
ncbi:Vault protein inter-alpha-trypsin domain-containing protein [Oscillatoria nigro-viridis PCC 7112]|uniref:Vault protein inter-alpha-trypsin domain-containing protein n=1 Tax=Phormidium nigroviride PCC 7112 TaxID=179408 RepID=K9VS22_9CYAN|nr:VIT domain-containing protein [Oscillatoria nigro-viridis]AFZ10369.1 Vault protein inter-alpha-trypsin domain-containing protein [Oscillatoria nigro-viridis PCC 7112]